MHNNSGAAQRVATLEMEMKIGIGGGAMGW